MSVTTSGSAAGRRPAWEQRFRASAILFSAIALDAPDVGLVSSNASGVPQLYRWDTAHGRARPSSRSIPAAGSSGDCRRTGAG